MFFVYKCFCHLQSHLSVCLSNCDAPTFESFELESLLFGMLVDLQNYQVKFVYQSYRVKVKVTETKKWCIYPVYGWSTLYL